MFKNNVSLFLLACFLAFTTALPLHKRTTCSSAVQKLVDGINDNITVQKQEQAQTKVIQQELAQTTPDQDDFQISKSKLIDIVNNGISIRTNNQKIAPSGNAAVSGLATVSFPISIEMSPSNPQHNFTKSSSLISNIITSPCPQDLRGNNSTNEITGSNSAEGGVEDRSGTDW
jgi:hypothetical protein